MRMSLVGGQYNLYSYNNFTLIMIIANTINICPKFEFQLIFLMGFIGEKYFSIR